jgi:hypothetical protein
MRYVTNIAFTLLVLPFFLLSCKKNTNQDGVYNNSPANIIFKYKFDSTQTRLNNIGLPAAVAAGRGAQSPVFNAMSSHYIELAPGPLTPLGGGVVAYKASETNAGGTNAIDFSQSVKKGNGEGFHVFPINKIPIGSYQYLRVSLAYQNYDIQFKFGSNLYTGTAASFIGFNTYISSFNIKNMPLAVNAAKPQGFWAFEAQGNVLSGQSPPGATTVPNPIFATSPIPAGSCVVTGPFLNASGANGPLVITGNETRDIVITVSLSTNKSLEWTEVNADGYYEPAIGEAVVDMGVRGLKPFVNL